MPVLCGQLVCHNSLDYIIAVGRRLNQCLNFCNGQTVCGKCVWKNIFTVQSKSCFVHGHIFIENQCATVHETL